MTISVIVPTYNRADLLMQTVESVLAQTRLPEEILIVDDGSTDDTRNAVAARFGDNPLVRYHYQENAWLGAARNTGFRLAAGDTLLFLDSDDCLMPEALRTLEAALGEQPKAVLAYCGVQIIDENGGIIEAETRGGDWSGDVWRHLLSGNFIRSPGCALVRRSAMTAAGLFDEAMRSCEDWDQWLRLAEVGPFVRVCGAPLFQYRVSKAAMSQDHWRMHENNLTVYRKLRERYTGDRERTRLIAAAEDGYLRDAVRGQEGTRVLKPQHRLARVFLERTGLAALYRRTPYRFRIALRRLAGIGRQA